jgi:flagellar hook assembly protein FlgD
MPAPAPNPFSSLTAIRLDVPAAMPVALAVYDVSGRRVAVLEDGYRDAGVLTRMWDGRDENGRRVSPGIYVARASAGDRSIARKVVLID